MNDPCDDQVPDSVSGRLRRPRMIVAGLVLALVSSAAALREAAADVFTLENGERLEGTIVHATRNTIIIRRDIGGIRQVRAEDLTEVAITASDGGLLVGQLLGWADGVYELSSNDRVLRVQDGAVIAATEIEPTIGPALTAPAQATTSPAIETAPATATAAPQTAPATEPTATAAAEPKTAIEPPAPEPTEIPSAATTPAAESPVEEPAVAETEPPADEGEIAALDQDEAEAPPPAADGEPRLAIDASAEPVAESVTTLVFQVKLSRPAKRSVVVIYATVDGTAKAGTDYEAQQGVITIQPGATTAELHAPLIDDDQAEGEEHFRLFLSTDPTVADVSAKQVRAVIQDDD